MAGVKFLFVVAQAVIPFLFVQVVFVLFLDALSSNSTVASCSTIHSIGSQFMGLKVDSNVSPYGKVANDKQEGAHDVWVVFELLEAYLTLLA